MTNIFEPEWTFEVNEHPWRLRGVRVGADAGAERLGATLYEVAPGGRVSPLHAHHANEELIVVLDGRPTLTTSDGSRELRAGEVIACPAGRRGTHQISNNSADAIRVLVVSTMVFPEVVEHPEDERVLAMTAPLAKATADDILLMFRRRDAVRPGSSDAE
jgi:uncharacterized cupin superfamily protein